MKWLQATFANRYHRFRKLQGKLFQGRYKSLIVEEDLYLGGLQHYVHLNPVRAGMCSIESLKDYRWSSFWYLNHPSKRPLFLDLSGALEHAGSLKDTSLGRRKYVEYLSWLSSNEAEQKELAFSKMCHGWALGTKEYKKKLLATEGLLKDGNQQALRLEGKELREANELQWEHLLERGLVAVDKTPDDIFVSRKSAYWKVWIAYHLKRHSSASNVWISSKLNMGAPQAVSLHTGRFDPHGATSKKGYNGFVQRFTK